MPDLLLEAKISKAARKANGDISFTVTTVGEMESGVLAQIDEVRDTPGHLLFSATEIDTEKLPDFAPIEKGDKPPSQRQRAVIYRMYEVWPKRDTLSFDEYYLRVMETIITDLKSRLPEPSF